MHPQAKKCRSRPRLEEAKNGTSPRASGGSVALVTPGFQTSGFQNCERNKFRLFRAAQFGKLFQQLQETNPVSKGLWGNRSSWPRQHQVLLPALVWLVMENSQRGKRRSLNNSSPVSRAPTRMGPPRTPGGNRGPTLDLPEVSYVC